MVGSNEVRSHWIYKIRTLVTFFLLWQESISYFCKVIISSRTAECVISGLQVNILRLISKLSVFMLLLLLLSIARCFKPLLYKHRMRMCWRLWVIKQNRKQQLIWINNKAGGLWVDRWSLHVSLQYQSMNFYAILGIALSCSIHACCII